MIAEEYFGDYEIDTNIRVKYAFNKMLRFRI